MAALLGPEELGVQRRHQTLGQLVADGAIARAEDHQRRSFDLVGVGQGVVLEAPQLGQGVQREPVVLGVGAGERGIAQIALGLHRNRREQLGHERRAVDQRAERAGEPGEPQRWRKQGDGAHFHRSGGGEVQGKDRAHGQADEMGGASELVQRLACDPLPVVSASSGEIERSQAVAGQHRRPTVVACGGGLLGEEAQLGGRARQAVKKQARRPVLRPEKSKARVLAMSALSR